MPTRTLFTGLSLSLLLAGAALAQDGGGAPAPPSPPSTGTSAEPDPRPPRPHTSFGVWLGLSFDASTTSPHASINRDFLVLGLRAGRPLRVTGATRLSWVVELTPVMLLSNPTTRTSRPACTPGSYCAYTGTGYRAFLAGRTTYGVGLAPLGMELEIGGSEHRLGGVLDLAGGGAYFTGPVPGSTRFDFTAAGGAALRWRIGGGKSLAAGYKLYHISNGGLGDLNPGFNAHLFYLAFGS